MIKIPMVICGELALDVRCNGCHQNLETTIIKNDDGFLILVDSDHKCLPIGNNITFLKGDQSDD